MIYSYCHWDAAVLWSPGLSVKSCIPHCRHRRLATVLLLAFLRLQPKVVSFLAALRAINSEYHEKKRWISKDRTRTATYKAAVMIMEAPVADKADGNVPKKINWNIVANTI